VNATSIKAAAARGVRWNGLASGSRIFFLTVRTAILARLLSQRDFGLASMVTVVLGYAQAYVDLGLSSAVIQKQEHDPDRLSTLFWVNVIAGIVSGLVLFAMQTPIAMLFKEPALAELIPAAALQLPVAALGQQFEALFQRDLHFKLVAIAQIVGDACSTLAAFLLALGGYGAWSLVLGTLVGVAVNSLLMFFLGLRHWRVRFVFQPSAIKPHLRFGAYQLANINVGYLTSNLDSVLVGRLIGAEALGVYSLALRITQTTRRYVNPIVAKVAFPIFAKQKEDKGKMAETLLQLQRSLSHLNAPLIVGLFVVGPILIPVVYGKNWMSAVPLLQVLCVVALLNGVSGPTQIVRTALGHVRFNFHWTWITGIAYGLAMWSVARHGLMAMVISRTVLTFCFGLSLVVITLRFLDTSFLRFLQTLRVPLLGSAVMAAAVYAVLAVSHGLPQFVRLLLGVVVGGGVYIAVSARYDREFLERGLRLLLGVQPRKDAARPVS
jgi:O-antigen/teichoic acid export membrane protein